MSEAERLTDEQVEEIIDRHSAMTPGPYRWEIMTIHRSARLESVRNMHDIVMDFVRWGMGEAGPRFRDEPFGIMQRIEHWAKNRRPHHVGFDQTIDHPDAIGLEHSWQDVDALLADRQALLDEITTLRRLLAQRTEAYRTEGD